MTTARESRRAGHSTAETQGIARPSITANSATSRGQRTSVFESLLVGALTAYAKLPEDLRPAPGTCVVIERGRDTDVKGRVLGYDGRGVAVQAKFAFLGELRVYVPWSAVKAILEVDA